MLTDVRARYPILLLAGLATIAAITAIRPVSYGNWIAETFPAILGVAILFATFRRFPLTPLAYTVTFLFAVILFVGGHYTYARVPLGEWMKHGLGFQRNHFDRIGHFMQGFTPALLIRELLLRASPLRRGALLFALVVACCLAISATYELFEWRYAVAFGGEAAENFLGSQGDPWDAQQDMAMALAGSIAAQVLLARLHDRQIARMGGRG